MLRPTRGVYEEGSARNRFFKLCEMSRSERSSLSVTANMSSRFFPFRVGQAIVFPVIVENPDAADDADRGTLK